MGLDVVVHHLDQARKVLRAAEALSIDVQLRSAPSAAAADGVGYLHALGEAVGRELWIDCHDDAGIVMAALRTGCRKLIFDGPPDLHRRLKQMAEHRRAVIERTSERTLPCLTLSPDDDEAAIQPLLRANAEG